MPGNKKARKPHSVVLRAKRIVAQAQSRIDRRPMTRQQIRDISLAAHQSFEALRRGYALEDHWHNLAIALNWTLVLAENGIGNEFVQVANEAVTVAFEAKLRGEDTGRWGFGGDAQNTIRAALELHDEQIEIATIKDLAAAKAVIESRIAAGTYFKREALAA
jgi:hypothetical protein